MPTRMTRRQAIAAGLGVAAGATLPVSARASGGRSARHDVAIVGAGLAGVAAARALRTAGASVVLLEARNRVGGRVLNAPIGAGEVVEAGGEWIGPGQERVQALATAVGVGTFPTHDTGDYLFAYQSTVSRYRDLIPPLPEEDAIEFFNAFVELETAAAGIDVHDPAGSAEARALDAQSAEDYKQTLVTAGARHLVDVFCQTTLAAEASDLSRLHLLFYAAAAGEGNGDGFTRLSAISGGAQELRFVGGSQLVVDRAAAELPAGAVRVRAAVRRIERAAHGVELCTDSERVLARRAIVAMSPRMAAQIQHSPALPIARQALQANMPNGRVIKINVVYETPFWRAAGLSGFGTADAGPVGLTYDNSPPDGAPGAIVAFIEASRADYWRARPAAQRRQAVLDQLVRAFGPPAASPIQYLEKDWTTDRWTRGCYGGYFRPRGWTHHGVALRAPVGPIHWAGSETATEWMGYMEGAVQSGQRAAADVLATL